MSEHNGLREKIAQAKRRLPLPALMERLGLAKHANKSAHCPFHKDEHKSFSVFKGADGYWHWKCFTGCGDGDEIMFISRFKQVPLRKAMSLYLDIAGFPPSCPPVSREYPKSPASPVSHVSPVSEEQELETELRELAVQNVCIERNTARKKRFKLVRDLKAIEKGISRELITAELILTFDEWYRLSSPFLDPAKTRDDYLALFLAELDKVRVPTGEGATLDKALTSVAMLSASELPMIPAHPSAPETWRRIAGLHRELSRLAANGTYFLSYRDAATVCDGLSQQKAHTITGALAKLGVIQIVSKGDARPNGGKAAEFRYVLPHSENGAEENDGGLDL